MNDEQEQKDDTDSVPDWVKQAVVYNEAESEARRSKVYRCEKGKLVETNQIPQNEHKEFLRAAGCESDVFTATTAEELHEIVDAELAEMTQDPPTPRGCELLKSWLKFRHEMCRSRRSTEPWVGYLHRDAIEDLVMAGSISNLHIPLKNKIIDTLKIALYKNTEKVGDTKLVEDWDVEDLVEKFNLDAMQSKCVNDTFMKSGAKIGHIGNIFPENLNAQMVRPTIEQASIKARKRTKGTSKFAGQTIRNIAVSKGGQYFTVNGKITYRITAGKAIADVDKLLDKYRDHSDLGVDVKQRNFTASQSDLFWRDHIIKINGAAGYQLHFD